MNILQESLPAGIRLHLNMVDIMVPTVPSTNVLVESQPSSPNYGAKSRRGRGAGRGRGRGRGRDHQPMHRPISYAAYVEMGDNIQMRTKYRPKLALICGSGLSVMADVIENPEVISFRSIQGFPRSTVEGHTGELVFGTVSGVEVVVMKGRFHPYEGYPLRRIVAPVRLFSIIGVTTLVVTNTSGGLNPNFKLGDIMLIKDHINMLALANQSPLTGSNIDEFGPRFPALNRAYNLELLRKAKAILINRHYGDDSSVKEGIYCGVGGPTYGTIAEARLLRQLGADVKGMSTVGEVVTAVHAGMTVLGISLISAMSPMDYDSEVELCHEEVLEVVKKKGELLTRFFYDLVVELGPDLIPTPETSRATQEAIREYEYEDTNDGGVKLKVWTT